MRTVSFYPNKLGKPLYPPLPNRAPAAGAAQEREPGLSPLGRDEAGGRPEKPARRHLRHGVPERQRMRMRQDVLASGSYISSNDRRPHFGLGDATDAGTAEIHWPSGARETVSCSRWTASTPSPRARELPARCATAGRVRRPASPETAPLKKESGGYQREERPPEVTIRRRPQTAGNSMPCLEPSE